MPQAVRITNLPGVGRRLEFEVGDHLVAVVITHLGERHLFIQEPQKDEPHLWLNLDDEQARVLAAVLLGVYGSPIEGSSGIEVGDVVVRGMLVPPGSETAGLTVGEFHTQHPGLVVIAAEHENDVDFSPQHEDLIEPGVLVIAGPRKEVDQVR